ncbi:hypothetical protein DVH05_007135 [Phytophthora capsici]|nr:hypothetical protein DVH05_007135 [Phytophthora capsici]
MGRGLPKELTQREKEDVVRYLLQLFKNDKLVHGAQKAAADMFGINRNTVSAIWKGKDILSSKKKGRVGVYGQCRELRWDTGQCVFDTNV